MLHETLTTDPEAWGLSPVQYASREKARRRARERSRREKALADFRSRLIPMEVEAVIETGPFMTASGIRAYRQWVPNRTALGSAPLTAKGEGGYVSLPFVSILANRSALETKEGRG